MLTAMHIYTTPVIACIDNSSDWLCLISPPNVQYGSDTSMITQYYPLYILYYLLIVDMLSGMKST